MVERPRNQTSEMHFDKFPKSSTLQCGKTSFTTEVCFLFKLSHGRYTVDQRDGRISGLSLNVAVNGRASIPKFEMLDAEIASALKEIIINAYVKKNVNLEEEKAQMEDRFLLGRQIAFMIYEHFFGNW